MRSTHLLRFILFLSSPIWMAMAFPMSVGTASECAPFTVSWTGGQSPFEIAIFPVSNSPSFYSVSSSTSQGSYTISQLLLPQGIQFVVMMSDATGFATGGTTDVITVAGPTSSSGCNTTPPPLSYIFIDDTLPLQQCAPSEFSGYQGAILPVTFLGIIPGGESSILQSGVTTATYNWTADVQAGTSIIFSMLDADNNTGGCSPLHTVGSSNDASCLSSSSPSSTTSIPQSSQSGSSSPFSTSPSTTLPSNSQTGSSSSTNISVAAIAGIAVGGVFALAAMVILGLCFIQRRRRNNSTYPPPNPRNSPPCGSTRSTVHTDIEDAPRTASPIIELPPQY